MADQRAGDVERAEHRKQARRHRRGRWIFVGWAVVAVVLWFIFGQVLSLIVAPIFLGNAVMEHQWMRSYERMARPW